MIKNKMFAKNVPWRYIYTVRFWKKWDWKRGQFDTLRPKTNRQIYQNYTKSWNQVWASQKRTQCLSYSSADIFCAVWFLEIRGREEEGGKSIIVIWETQRKENVNNCMPWRELILASDGSNTEVSLFAFFSFKTNCFATIELQNSIPVGCNFPLIVSGRPLHLCHRVISVLSYVWRRESWDWSSKMECLLNLLKLTNCVKMLFLSWYIALS